MGNTDDGTLHHSRVLHQHVFDLPGKDVEAPGDDHVLLSIHDVQVACRIEVTDIAGMNPAIADGLRIACGIHVTDHLAVLPGADLTDFSHRQDVVVIVLY